MIDLPSLYPHQEDLRDRTRAALAKHGRVILCANPGFGKTRCSKWILGTAANRAPLPNQTGRSLFCVHRRGLVDNASISFTEDPKLPHGMIMSGVQPAYGHRIQVASIDTMLSWFMDDGFYGTDVTFDLIVFDECHSHHAKLARFLQKHDEKRAALGQHPAYVIGLTATPQARGLADVYREIVLGPSTQWLIENRFLSPFRYFRGTQGKLGLLVKRGDEFTKDSEAKAMEGLAGDLVRDWKKFADGRPTVGFFPRRSHAQDAQEQLEKAGLRVAYVDGETDDDVRRGVFWSLNNHKIDYLCNVQVVERGTDIPRIGCVQLCVAIGSVVRYRQMIGRGSRIHPEKTDCCVARDTMILTDRGEVPIQNVRLTDRVWDGMEFCSHDGPCCNGTKEVIKWNGLTLTPDHKVLTNDGWQKAQTAEACQGRLVVGGLGGTPVWTTDGSNPHDSRQWTDPGSRSGLLPLWEAWLASLSQDRSKEASWVRALYAEIRPSLPGVGLEASSAPTAEMPVSTERSLFSIRRAGNRVQVFLNLRRGVLGCEESWIAFEQGVDYRPEGQQRPLRTGKPSVGDDGNAVTQSGVCVASEVSAEAFIRDVLRHPTLESQETRHDPESDRKPMAVEVWDILNCGPRNRYCANGVIVANCVLDHGGNILRHGFFEDDPKWSLDISSKDAGSHKTRPSIECPKCEAIYRGGKCRNCGYEPSSSERRGQGLEFDGQELKEVSQKEKKPVKVKSAEALMVSALYIAGKSGRTWRQCCGIFNGLCKRQGTERYRIPSSVTVHGHRYQMPRAGSSDAWRKVGLLFPFTISKGDHSGDYLEEPQTTAGEPY